MTISVFHRCWTIALLVLPLVTRGQTTPPVMNSLEGRVVAPDKKPVAGAKVSVFAFDQTRDEETPLLATGVTDSQGNFCLSTPRIPMGIVAVQARGFGVLLMQAPLNENDDPLAIELAEPATVKVQVIGVVGQPAAGIRVVPISSMQSLASGAFGYWPRDLARESGQLTDASGIATFTDLPREARINFSVDDPRFNVVSVIGNRFAETTTPPREPTAITLEPAGTIQGRVLFSDTGGLAPGIEVAAGAQVGPGAFQVLHTKTDAQGRFQIDHLRTSDVQLMPNMPESLSAKYAGVIKTVTIQGGQVLTGVDLSIGPGAVLRGKVADPQTGQGIAGISITVDPTSSPANRDAFSIGLRDRWPSATTALDGTYELHLVPRRYTVRPKAPNHLNLDDAGRNVQEVDLSGGNDATMDFTFKPAERPAVGLVKGVVVDEQDNPVPEVEIAFHIAPPYRNIITGNIPRNPNVQRVYSDASGHFEFNLTGPSAAVYARKGPLGLPPQPPANPATRVLMMGGGVPSSVIVTAENRELRLVLKKAAGSGVVHVVQADGKPLAGAVVGLGSSYPWSTLARRWGTTGPDGTVTFDPIYPDRSYDLSVYASGYAPQGSGGTDTITLVPEPGGRVDTRPFVLRRTDNFIEGIVVDEQDNPMTNTIVIVRGGRIFWQNPRTDAAGRFRLDGLYEGEELTLTPVIGSGAGARGRPGQPVPVTVGKSSIRITALPSPTGQTPSGRARGAGVNGPATRP